MITPEELTIALDNAKADIVKKAVENISSSMATSLHWQIQQELSGVVNAAVTTELKDDIEALLKENRALILESLKNSIAEVSAELGKTLVAQAAKNLTGYNGTEIIKKLFGGY